MNVYKPPNIPPLRTDRVSVFLAGSIEMGAAEKWQDKVIASLADLDIDVFNPRRDDWDSSWVQSKDNPQFREQVQWELDMINYASHVFMYLQPGTQSPISLLELGLMANTGQLWVVCPGGFWRKGNVDLVCERTGQPVFDSLDEGVRALREWLEPFIVENP